MRAVFSRWAFGVGAFCAGAAAAQPLPGTRPLSFDGDPASAMVEGIHSWLDRETAAAREARSKRTAPPDREKFRTLIGAVDPRVPSAMVYDSREPVATGRGYRAYAVRWAVFEGVDGEGLLFEPDGQPKASVVAIPDAGTRPERFAMAQQFARAGCRVLVPVLIDRENTWSGIPGVKMTNQPHREWIYRMSFEAGRTIIGYEVQKALAAVDWFQTPVAVAGEGEGGLIALYAAALDTRITATLVSGYFGPRDQLWKEPIYREVWGLLREYGDAEIAAMIAPRKLIVDTTPAPEVKGPPPETRDRRGAAPAGSIVSPSVEAVRAEAGARATVANGNGAAALLSALRIEAPAVEAVDLRPGYDDRPRMHRQFDQLVAHTQALIRKSEYVRPAATSRETVWNDVIGRMPDPSIPADPRSRLIFDEPKYRGYEVMLDVWPGVFAYGILLVPKDLRAGERRPVVVCQHGLEGRPRDAADPKIENAYYHRYAVRLAEEGFITFAPQNPYIGQDRFRLIQRKGHPLKLSLFSFILGQHQRILEWLGGLPFVDAKRIGFYGLSYGGKTAVRVPPLLDGYALSICSADFNEWVWKTTSVESPYSYMLTQEYDMLEWNFANVTNYSNLANLMAPRPFMVERGHDDTVAPDHWVAYEYAKVRRHYVKAGIPERTEIEFFNGPHSIHGVGTFAFLRRWLHFPE
jgi:dienelactone hydrolase